MQKNSFQLCPPLHKIELRIPSKNDNQFISHNTANDLLELTPIEIIRFLTQNQSNYYSYYRI